MLKSCKYCMRVHDTKYDCGMKSVRKNRRTDQDSFRNTIAWQKKRDEIKERDNYLCQICIRNRYNTVRIFNYSDLSVHHATKLNDDYDKRLDDDNLITLCERHHKLADDGIIPREEILEIIQEQIHPPGGIENI